MNTPEVFSHAERMNVADYGRVADFLIQEVNKTGGVKKHLYPASGSKGSSVNGIAWAYIRNMLQYLANDQTIDAYNAVVRWAGLSPEDIDQIAAHPFNKCTEIFFFALQNKMLSYYENLDFDYVRKLIEVYVIRTSSYQLTLDRKGSLVNRL